MNIKDIAKKAGVSIGTVDRVLHNRGRVSKENIDKIMTIVKEAGYEPNSIARRLKTQEKFNFGVLIPSLDSEFGYWKQVYKGINDASLELKRQDIQVSYEYFDRTDPNSFITAADNIMKKGIDAYIVAPLLPKEMEIVSRKYNNIPFIFIDSSHPSISCLSDLSQDPVTAGCIGARLMNLISPLVDKVFTIQTFSSAYNGKMRASSFTSYMKEIKPSLEVINIAVEEYEDILKYFSFSGKDEKVGLFIVNDGSYEICKLIRENNIENEFTIIGFDLSPNNKKMLDSGQVAAILGQRPITQAYDALMLLYKKFVLNLEIDRKLSSSVDIYFKENMPQTEFWL